MSERKRTVAEVLTGLTPEQYRIAQNLAPAMADLLRRFVSEADALDESVLPIAEARKLLKEIEGK